MTDRITKILLALLLGLVVSIPWNAALSQSSTDPKCGVALSIAREGSDLVRQRTQEMNKASADVEAKRAEPNALLEKMRFYSEAKVKLYHAFKGLRDAGYCGQDAPAIEGALRAFESGPLGKLVK